MNLDLFSTLLRKNKHCPVCGKLFMMDGLAYEQGKPLTLTCKCGKVLSFNEEGRLLTEDEVIMCKYEAIVPLITSAKYDDTKHEFVFEFTDEQSPEEVELLKDFVTEMMVRANGGHR